MDALEWTVLSVVFYLVVVVLVGLYAFSIRRASVFEPISQYLFFVSLFTLPLPVRSCITLEIEGNVTPYLQDILPYLPIAVFLMALSLPVFAFGYYGSWARHLACSLPLPLVSKRDHSRFSFVLMASFSFSLIYLLTADSGGLLAFLLLGYGSSAEIYGRGYLAIGFPWLFIASLFLLYRYARFRRFADFVFFAFALGVVIVIQLLTGNRSMILYMGLVVMIFVNFAITRLRLSFLLPFGFAAFIAMNLIGLMRTSNYENYGEFIEKSASSAVLASSDDPHGLFYTLTVGEFVVPFETLPQMIRTVGVSRAPWLGWSYLRAPSFAIPSVIFPDRSLPLANWYMQEFYGGGFLLNEGRQFFFMAEAYLNFLFVGVFFLALFWGVFWGGVHQWLKRSEYNPAVVLIYALAVGYIFRCVAGDFSSLLVGMTQQSLVAALIGLAFAGVSWRFSKEQVGLRIP